MKASLEPIKRNEIFVLSEEKQKLRNLLIQKVDESLADWTDQIADLYKEDLEFREKAETIIKTLIPHKSYIKVKTTVGPQDSIVQEYVGLFTKSYGGCLFNIKPNGMAERTIGSSCLCYIEVLNLNGDGQNTINPKINDTSK